MNSKYIIVALVVALCSCVVLGQNETDASPESQLESPPLQSESPSQLLESLPQQSSPPPQEPQKPSPAPQEAPSQAPSSPAPPVQESSQAPSSPVQESSPAPQEAPSPAPQEPPSPAPQEAPSQAPSPAPPAPHEPAPILAENHVVAYNEPNPANELVHFSLPPQPKWEPANHIANLNAESAQLNESSSEVKDDDKGDKEQPALVKLCMDFLHDNETCHHLYSLCNNEQYLRLTWEVTYRVFFERPFGIVLFVVWTVMLCILNFVILFLCTLLKPLRSILLTKIVSDLRRRYYFTNDASELRVVDSNNIKK